MAIFGTLWNCDHAKLLEVSIGIVFVKISWKHMKNFFFMYGENIMGVKDGL